MAKIVVITDDLDGSPDAETVRFALRGQAYEIDLTAKNLDKLEKALEPFITAGRPLGGDQVVPAVARPSVIRTRRARGTTAAPTGRVDYSDIRYAGNVHRGKVTEAEAETVRDNLDTINDRLESEGRPKIDPSDPKMKTRYGF